MVHGGTQPSPPHGCHRPECPGRANHHQFSPSLDSESPKFFFTCISVTENLAHNLSQVLRARTIAVTLGRKPLNLFPCLFSHVRHTTHDQLMHENTPTHSHARSATHSLRHTHRTDHMHHTHHTSTKDMGRTCNTSTLRVPHSIHTHDAPAAAASHQASANR